MALRSRRSSGTLGDTNLTVFITALIAPVPAAESLVGALRSRYDSSAALGVPAHITILFPFMPPSSVTPAVLSTLQEALRSISSFDFTLASVECWPETAYLAPSPVKPFIRLIETVAAAFPAYPPYGGQHHSIVPHLTVANGNAQYANAATSELKALFAAQGPVAANCTEIALIENSTGKWREMHKFSLAPRVA